MERKPAWSFPKLLLMLTYMLAMRLISHRHTRLVNAKNTPNWVLWGSPSCTLVATTVLRATAASVSILLLVSSTMVTVVALIVGLSSRGSLRTSTNSMNSNFPWSLPLCKFLASFLSHVHPLIIQGHLRWCNSGHSRCQLPRRPRYRR